MSLAILTNIEKTFGKRVIFDKLSLTIYPGERVGFIGANGAGKTTLFKVLTGEVVPDYGTVALAAGTKVGYLKQDPVFEPGNTVIDEAETGFAELHRLAHRLRDLEHAMADVQGDALDKLLASYQTAQHAFDLAGGYVWEHRLEATLLGVGLGRETWEQDVATLSGGQRSRLALARLLISEPDLLLLDEPTNHLDLAAIEWLEDYLLAFKGSVILISHDRFLLDRLATRIAWLHQCKVDAFKGNYSSFVAQRELLDLTQQRAYEQQQEYIAKQEEYIRRFKAGQRARQASGRASRLDTLMHSESLVQQTESQRHIHLSLNTDKRAGDRVLEVKDLSKSFGEKKLWRDVRFGITRGDRVGIIGPNGSGKTTMLKVLLGQEDADAGDIRWGASLNIGYYDQRLDEFDPESSILDEVGAGRSVTEKQIRDACATVLFRGDDVYKPVGLLSGGERARVRLAQLLLDKPNVLLLDEPTNHLDIASCEALEQALSTYAGTIFCVSHDRYFLDKVASRLIVLHPPGFTDFTGNYSAYARKRLAEEKAASERAQRGKASAAKPKPVEAPKPVAPPAKKDNPYKRPFGRLGGKELEAEIQKAEAAIVKLEASASQPDTYKNAAKAQQTQKELDAQVARLAALEAEYFAREG